MLNKIKIQKIEAQMMSFLNLIENYSMTSDDLVTIFDNANKFLKDPLKSIISDYVIEVRLYGNNEEATKKLYQALAGTKLLEVIKNLNVCAFHEANYGQIIEDCKISVKEYLKSKEIRKSIINSAKVDVIALFIAGVFVVKILNEFLSSNVIEILMSSYLGIGIIFYCIIILGISVYMIVWGWL